MRTQLVIMARCFLWVVLSRVAVDLATDLPPIAAALVGFPLGVTLELLYLSWGPGRPRKASDATHR